MNLRFKKTIGGNRINPNSLNSKDEKGDALWKIAETYYGDGSLSFLNALKGLNHCIISNYGKVGIWVLFGLLFWVLL